MPPRAWNRPPVGVDSTRNTAADWLTQRNTAGGLTTVPDTRTSGLVPEDVHVCNLEFAIQTNGVCYLSVHILPVAINLARLKCQDMNCI